MTRIELSAQDAYSIASLMHLTDKDNDQLSAVILRTFRNNTTALATDRYLIGMLRIDSVGEDSPKDYGLTVEACKFITANAKPKRGTAFHTVVIELDTENSKVTITIGASTHSDTYPKELFGMDKLIDLIEAWQPLETAVPVNLSIKLFEQLAKLRDGFNKPDAWKLELGANQRSKQMSGPIRAIVAERFTVLMQPRHLK